MRDGSDADGADPLEGVAAPADNSSGACLRCCCAPAVAGVPGTAGPAVPPPMAEGAPGWSWWVTVDPVAPEREGLLKQEPISPSDQLIIIDAVCCCPFCMCQSQTSAAGMTTTTGLHYDGAASEHQFAGVCSGGSNPSVGRV